MTDEHMRWVYLPPFHWRIVNGLSKPQNGLTNTKIVSDAIAMGRQLIRVPEKQNYERNQHILKQSSIDIARSVHADIKILTKYELSLSTLIGLVGLEGFCLGRGRPLNRPDAEIYFGGVLDEE